MRLLVFAIAVAEPLCEVRVVTYPSLIIKKNICIAPAVGTAVSDD